MNELLVKSKVTTGVENERTADLSPEAWQAFHHQFRDCVSRRETWAQLFDYWRERCGKAAAAEGNISGPGGTGSDRARQRFLSDAAWDEEKLMARYHEQVRAALGDRDAAMRVGW
ncbi:MAG: hypothetical protein NTZ24_15065 [Deltaproteobacteria bacterium]|nr:hypothetical protein [Deltaproteobacteria bacterium]